MTWRHIAAGLGVVGLSSGCAESERPAPETKGIHVQVAPLTLPGITDADFGIAVKNASGETVWAKPSLTSNQWGNGSGSLSYVGPCDATDNPNSVELVLNSLTPGGDFANPCEAGVPCELLFTCVENSDVAVTFNLTIMRKAQQGFFDIAVNFNNIFCSAKVDCAYDNGAPIELLFNPSAPELGRGQTAVVAFACSAGPGDDVATNLHIGVIELACDGQPPILLDPTRGPGNAYGPPPNQDPDLNDAVWQYAVYPTWEELTCDDDGALCNKVSWSMAVGFDPDAEGCVLTTRLTASDLNNENMPGNVTPENSSYPVIDVNVALTGQSGGVVCTQNPMDGPGSGVTTGYTPVGTQETFCSSSDGSSVGNWIWPGQDSFFSFMGSKNLSSLLNVEGQLAGPCGCMPTVTDEANDAASLLDWGIAAAAYYDSSALGGSPSPVAQPSVDLSASLVRATFLNMLYVHFYGGGFVAPSAFFPLRDVPQVYGTQTITTACEQAARMNALLALAEGCHWGPTLADCQTLITFAQNYAGPLTHTSDPLVVAARAAVIRSFFTLDVAYNSNPPGYFLEDDGSGGLQLTAEGVAFMALVGPYTAPVGGQAAVAKTKAYNLIQGAITASCQGAPTYCAAMQAFAPQFGPSSP